MTMSMNEVAHLWAKQERHSAGQGTNVFFEGKVIYSYGSHFPMACFYEWNGKHAILETSRGYSVSTARHLGVARYAAYKTGLPCFYVTTPEPLTPPHRYADEFLVSAKVARRDTLTAVTEVKPVRCVKRLLESFRYWKQRTAEFAEFFDVHYDLEDLPCDHFLWDDYAKNRDAKIRRRRKECRQALKLKAELLHQHRLREGQEIFDFTWRALSALPSRFSGESRGTVDNRYLGFSERKECYG